jgi:hypothetical protein
MPGFDVLSTRTYKTRLTGGPLPNDFTGPLTVRLKANLNAPCTPDDCQTPALVEGSASIDAP